MWVVLVLAAAVTGFAWWRTRPVEAEDATVEAAKQVEKEVAKPAEAGVAQAMSELSQDPASIQATAEAEAPEPVWEAPAIVMAPVGVPVPTPTVQFVEAVTVKQPTGEVVFVPGGIQQIAYDDVRWLFSSVMAGGQSLADRGYVYTGVEDLWVKPESRRTTSPENTRQRSILSRVGVS